MSYKISTLKDTNTNEYVYPVTRAEAVYDAQGNSVSTLLNNVGLIVTPDGIGAVPDSRTVNGKALNTDISLDASDVGAPTVAEMDTAINQSVTTFMNRTTAVNADDTNYTTIMTRGSSLNSTDTTPTVNGTICWTYA